MPNQDRVESMFLKEKRDRKIKGELWPGGNKQRDYISKEDAGSLPSPRAVYYRASSMPRTGRRSNRYPERLYRRVSKTMKNRRKIR
jgi:hypothetical protein